MKLNDEACGSWLTNKREVNKVEEVEVDPKELAFNIKCLESEIKFKSKEIKSKLEILYQLKTTKETYDKLVSLELICNN